MTENIVTYLMFTHSNMNFPVKASLEPLALTPNVALSYTGSITVGSTIVSPILFDSGSCQLWIDGSLLKSEGSIVLEGRQAPTIMYMDGTTVNGEYAKGDVTVGNVTAKALEFESATGIFSPYANDPTKAIMGLCHRQVEGASTSFLQAGVSSGVFKKNFFSYNIDPLSGKASLIFDGIDEQSFLGELRYSPVPENANLWQNTLTGIFSSDGSISYGKTSVAIVDTGTSFFIVPPTVATQFNSLFGFTRSSNGIFYGSCDDTTIANITVNIVLYGASLQVSAKDLLYDPTGRGSICYNAVSAGNGDQFILGNALLRNFYLVFDGDAHKVGYGMKNITGAASVGSGSDAPSSTSTDPVSNFFSQYKVPILGGLGVIIVILFIFLMCRSLCICCRQLCRTRKQTDVF